MEESLGLLAAEGGSFDMGPFPDIPNLDLKVSDELSTGSWFSSFTLTEDSVFSVGSEDEELGTKVSLKLLLANPFFSIISSFTLEISVTLSRIASLGSSPLFSRTASFFA